MKQYPKEQQDQNKMVIPQTFNTNTSIYENETNGGLNGQNMPVEQLTHLNFIAPAQSTATTTVKTTKWQGQTQQYKEVSRYAQDFAGDQYTYLLAYDLKTNDWNKGWNRLEELPNFSELLLDMDCKEGMLNGCFSINFRHGFNVVSTEGLTYVTGGDWWTVWGIFINDTLLAETDTCYPRLENLVVPFSVPVGTQSVRLDLRWKTYTTTAVGGGYTGDPTTDLEIFGAAIWARNTYR